MGLLKNSAFFAALGPLLVFALNAGAGELGPFGSHPGYTADVQKELHTIDSEVVLIDRPAETAGSSRPIFDDRLTKEFRSQFEYRFGTTEMEQTLNSPGRQDEYYYFTGRTVSLREYRAEQRSFGEYMGRRLVEHHVDQWAKSSPSFRPVYELKDKVTNLNMEVKKGYKAKIKYSLSGNHLDLNVDNPYDVEAKLRQEMGGDTILSLGKDVTKLWRVSTLMRVKDGVTQVVGTRRITPALSASITGSVDSREEGITEKQDLILVGFSYSN